MQVTDTKSKRIVLFGHSHVWAIRAAFRTRAYNIKTPNLDLVIPLCGTKQFPGDVISYDLKGAEQINSALLSALNSNPQTAQTDVYLASVVQGNAYNAIGLLLDGKPFDFVVSGHETLPLDKQADIVPFDAIRQMLTERCASVRSMFRMISKLGFAGIMHFEAPPPIRDNDFIMKKLLENNELAKAESIVNDPNVRLKLWLTQTIVMQDICLSLGVKYIKEVPGTSEKGYLAEHYRKDTVHATLEYGTALLTHAESIVNDWSR